MHEQDILAPYLSPKARSERLHQLVSAAGGELIELGHSVEGRALELARIPSTSREAGDLPRVLLCANIHGIEFITTYVALALLASISAPDAPVHALLQRAELWVLPSLNPDGYARTWRQQGAGTIKELRTNANGVDLNRNYPPPAARPWYAVSLGGWGTGSTNPKSAFFRGNQPLSEPETAALDALWQTTAFHASANLHSCMGTLLPAHTPLREDFVAYRALCRAFQQGQPQHKYRRIASRTFDWFTGEQEDHQHHNYKTWAICVEHFPIGATIRQSLFPERLFWRFNPRNPASWAANDLPGLVAYLLAALDLPSPA